MQLLSAALTHCRFEASHTAADEVVYLRILKLMEGMISGPGGELLSDESVCHVMETGLGLCCEPRFSQLLQRSAELTMVSMCQVVFERLKHLEFESGDTLEEETKDDMEAVKIEPGVNGIPEQESPEKNPDDRDASLDVEGAKRSEGKLSSDEPNASQIDLGQITVAEQPPPIKPYSLPSIKELFRSLVELLDPHDATYTDTMRVMALRIVDVALEVAGPSIANHPSLAQLAQNTLCRHLFQLVRSDNMAILNESLRVAGTLLATCRGVLKLQQELFLSYLVACLFPRVDIPHDPSIDRRLYEGVPQAPSLVKPSPSQSNSGSGRSTPVPVKDRQRLGLEGGTRKPDAREAMVESIGALVRMETFMTDLFVNYDCEIDRSDLCADMVGLMSRNAFPDAASWSTTNVPPLCLDALLSYVQSVFDRLEDDPATEGYPNVEELRKQRATKGAIIRGCAKFNESPKAGLAFLASQGVIKDVENPRHIAQFLQGSARIDKKVLGDFISKGQNQDILREFIDAFDFAGLRTDEALRQLLYTFRLPGESQLIERIVTVFCQKYHNDGNFDNVADTDSSFVLTYAIIMLNTDLYNPNIRSGKRMQEVDFARNLRGVNGGKDFDPEYLKTIYEAIKSNEIVLPEERSDRRSYEHAWKELLVKVADTKDLVICKTNVFDGDMFSATWKPIVATLTYVFVSASDDSVFSRIISGFFQCAQIAARYGLTDALDHIIWCLSSLTTLAAGTTPDTSLNTEVQANDSSVMVSHLAVTFGRDDRAQLATIVLFKILADNEMTVRDGWDHIIRIMLSLFVNSLIPSSFDAIKGSMSLGPIPLQPPVQVIDRSEREREGGLFSTLSSYVSSFTNDDPPEPSEQEIENTLCAIDCIKSCGFEDLLDRISQLPLEALVSVVESLLGQIPEDSSPRIIAVKSEVPLAVARSGGKIYDPSLVFVLELATLLTLRDAQTIGALGKEVASALQSVVRNAANYHFVVISRVTYYLLTLLRVSDDYDFVRTPVILHAFSSFDKPLLQRSAVPLLKGISDCIKNSSSGLRSEMSTSPDFWAILHSLQAVPEAAPHVFEILEDLAGAPHTGITVDNYEPAIALLNSFASAGSIGAEDERKRDIAIRRAKQQQQQHQGSVKPPKPKHRQDVMRGTKSVAIVYSLTSRVPSFITASHLETTEAWNTYWSPIFNVLSTQCLNPCREIRHQALASLQRALLSKELATPEHKHNEWTAIFTEVLFPLIAQLLKPEVYQYDPLGMNETRVLAATGLCKIFLHYLVVLARWDGLLALWVRILDIMERLITSGGSETLVSRDLTSTILDSNTRLGGSCSRIPQEYPVSHGRFRLSCPTR
jgi:brefeldin A-resistance guanine nucleotide exchange factor 1